MATKSVVVIYDKKSEIYTQPVFSNTKMDALRSIEHLMKNQADHPYVQFPHDFTMYEIAIYDDETLSFKNHGSPLELAELSQFAPSPIPKQFENGKYVDEHAAE